MQYNKNHKYTNKLINESSPYLLQHAHNPVEWYPWGEEALEKARKEHKLLLVSIGYAACHWCHVMERESFENEAIADTMNKYFVCIKVDREERPDIDQVYISAVQLLTGRGGWPLNCFALPDGRPVWGGTYFPPQQWENVLSSLSNSYVSDPHNFEKQAENLVKGIAASDYVLKSNEQSDFSRRLLEETLSNWEPIFDSVEGGNKGAPKFPLPNSLLFLLNLSYSLKNEDAKKHLVNTLDKMALGGIFDQLGGGFARYATDTKWKIPHFEKMLYDNGQLVSLYSMAWLLTNKSLYKNTVYATIEFVERELMSQEYGFYSSLDADSEGVEGKFYLWNKNEISLLPGADAEIFADYFSMTNRGNWEGSNILHIQQQAGDVAAKFDISCEQLSDIIENSKNILLKEREKRIRPGLDDKILTSWNALMLKGYTDAYKAFGEKRFLETALRNAAFLEKNMMANDFCLYRNYKEGVATINAFLDDYGLLAEAYISLFQVCGDAHWLKIAKGLCDYALVHFYDKETEMFFYTSDIDAPLAVRKQETSDNVTPASNSSMAKVLFLLSIYFENDDYYKQAEQMLKNVLKHIPGHGTYYSNWGQLLAWFVNPPFELVVVGNDALKYIRRLMNYRPDVLVAFSEEASDIPIFMNRFVEGKTMFYVCQNKVCKNPVYTIDQALEMVRM